MRLHALAAKVMLYLNPKRRFMINAPTWVMESIIADALPGGVHAGTIEMHEELERIGNLPFVKWLDSEEGRVAKARLIKPQEDMIEGSEKLEKALKQEFSSLFPYVERKGGTKESLLDFMDRNPPIISLGHQGKNMTWREGMTIYKAPDKKEVFLKIVDDSRDVYYRYQWMFMKPFEAVGGTHYMAVDLRKMAEK